MIKASSIEKRFFPWTSKRFAETLVDSINRLHWHHHELIGMSVIAKTQQDLMIGDVPCPLEFTLKASWREIGEGIEVVISVTEERNSWSIMECKKRCKVLMEFLNAPLYA